MREEIAELVHPIISSALQLKQRLDRQEDLDLATEQSHLKGLLQNELASKRWAEYGGEMGSGTQSINLSAMTGRAAEPGRRGSDSFLGIRYALVCWIDELFILDSPWSRQWNERKLEVALYGTNDRAWAFWEQARRAESRPGSDALEVFFLCVMLGFRGELREDPAKLKAWVDSTQARIAKSQGAEMPFPPELEAPIYVPPRHGREKLQRMVLSAAVLVIVFIPFLAYYVTVRVFGH